MLYFKPRMLINQPLEGFYHVIEVEYAIKLSDKVLDKNFLLPCVWLIHPLQEADWS